MAKGNTNHKHHFGVIGFLTVLNSLVIIVVFFMLIGAKQHMKKSAQSNMPQITSASYTCDGGKTISAQFFEDKAEIMLSDDRTLLLMQGLSGSGVRYTNSDESVTFWTKGNTAFLEEGSETTYNNCVEEKQ